MRRCQYSKISHTFREKRCSGRAKDASKASDSTATVPFVGGSLVTGFPARRVDTKDIFPLTCCMPLVALFIRPNMRKGSHTTRFVPKVPKQRDLELEMPSDICSVSRLGILAFSGTQVLADSSQAPIFAQLTHEAHTVVSSRGKRQRINLETSSVMTLKAQTYRPPGPFSEAFYVFIASFSRYDQLRLHEDDPKIAPTMSLCSNGTAESTKNDMLLPDKHGFKLCSP